jgi:hypothetical protein
MSLLRPLPLPLACAALVSGASGGSLTFTAATSVDISALHLGGVGDLAIGGSPARLWISDGTTGGDVYEIDEGSGALLSQLDPSVVPGLDLGPDALARSHSSSTDVWVFSSFNESEGGRMTTSGALAFDFGTSHGATGADIDTIGALWIAAGTAPGGGSTLMRLYPPNGDVLASVPILGTTQRVVDLSFDPHTGACYCLLESLELVEVDTASGAQLSSTDLSIFLPGGAGIAGGIAFSSTGEQLYVASTSGATAGSVVVLERDFATLVCDGAAPAACPCGNDGAPRRGCNNSFGTGGASLTFAGLPRVSDDDAFLVIGGLPPASPVLFFQGTTSNGTPIAVDDGLMCTGGSIVRLGTRTAQLGLATFPSPSEPELHVRGQIPRAGGTRVYQAWYRNAAQFCTPGTSNFSNAIEVHWHP